VEGLDGRSGDHLSSLSWDRIGVVVTNPSSARLTRSAA
jgi:hypothetical protein